VAFTYRGKSYEIDLSNKNLEALDKALAKYIDAARQTSTASTAKRGSGASRARSASDIDPKAVRAWAEAAGVEVNARGRLTQIRE